MLENYKQSNQNQTKVKRRNTPPNNTQTKKKLKKAFKDDLSTSLSIHQQDKVNNEQILEVKESNNIHGPIIEEKNNLDPFKLRFQRNLKKDLEVQIKNKTNWRSTFQTWSNLGNVEFQHPSVKLEVSNAKQLLKDPEEDILPAIGISLKCPRQESDLSECFIKQSISKKMSEYFEHNQNFAALQNELLNIMCNYLDLYYPENNFEKWDDIIVTYCVHILNHTLKNRQQVIQNNNKLNKETEEEMPRDQGFTRPKVLILLPFKHSAYKVVKTLMKLLFGTPKGTDVLKLKRFEEDFGPPSEEIDRSYKPPSDFLNIFTGDIKEDFKIGLSITKNSLKLYTSFYKSDIIVASPVALRHIIGASSDPKFDADFLSSIEILLLDQADILFMQNWEHILVIRDHLNKRPRAVENMTTDINRIRCYFLDDLAPLYQQTIIFSSINIDFHRAFLMKASNFAGKVQVSNLPSPEMEKIVPQSGLFLHSVKGQNDADNRFKFFTNQLFPQLRSLLKNHTMIYIPDYCDYVRLLHFFNSDGGTAFASIDEYMVSKNSKVAKIRTLFFDGKKDFLIYTERFHFYRRYKIKGVQNVIFYGLPTYPHFFSEICNFMVPEYQNSREPEMMSKNNIHVLYQASDMTKLLAILGRNKTSYILNSKKAIHKISL